MVHVVAAAEVVAVVGAAVVPLVVFAVGRHLVYLVENLLQS